MLMTYSIRSIISLLTLVLITHSCCDVACENQKWMEQCPYEVKATRAFNLEVPLEVIPHQKTYHVDDTITWRFQMSNDIFDWNRDRTFKIENFPFKPAFHLYRVENGAWTSGYADAPIIIDTIYRPSIQGGSTFAASLRGTSTYIDGEYLFEFKTVLKRPGIYINYVLDLIEPIVEEVAFGEVPEYNLITNSSGCPEIQYTVHHLLQGEPHYLDFANEMSLLDKDVYYDKWYQRGKLNEDLWGRLFRTDPVEWRGVFGFEVVE